MKFFKGIIFFVAVILISRLIPHPPNFTPLLAGIIFLPFFVKSKGLVLGIPLSTLFISDLLLGLHDHMLWTYGSLLLISLGTLHYFKEMFSRLILLAISAPTLFFVITNLGVWLNSGMYTKDLPGITECFVLALPFYANNLISTIIFVMAFYFIKRISSNQTNLIYR